MSGESVIELLDSEYIETVSASASSVVSMPRGTAKGGRMRCGRTMKGAWLWTMSVSTYYVSINAVDTGGKGSKYDLLAIL